MIALLMTAVLSGPAAERQVLSDSPDRCREVAERVRQDEAVTARKLGQLPQAHGEFAVMRKVEGCMVAVPMRFAPPVLRITPSRSPRRADAPGNRR